MAVILQDKESCMEPNSLEEPSAKVKINPPVFFTSVIIIVGLVLFSILFKTEAAEFFSTMKTGVQQYASWFYILTVAILLSLVVFVIVSRYGDIKLGPDHSEPD
ncbi:BCCT family transporter, partial [Alloalcanivorax xenomutans]